MIYRPLGSTGLQVSLVALGTVKFGRLTDLKYPQPFARPDDETLRRLFLKALDLGINLFDTAPAYGDSEHRLGRLLSLSSTPVYVATKVGESYDGGVSRHDFSAAHTRLSVERSLRRLGRERLDLVCIHSDGNDVAIIEQQEVVGTLMALRQEGLVGAIGLSGKTPEGIYAAIRAGLDVVMATVHPGYTDELPAIAAAHQAGLGVLVKKALRSGHAAAESLRDTAARPGVSSIVIGTINPDHLTQNVRLLDTPDQKDTAPNRSTH